MFGALHRNKDAQHSLEYIDLSAENNTDARYYTVLACDRCRNRKLKCSGDFEGCVRCQAASVECTYRSSVRSTDSPTSRRRQSTSEPRSALKHSAKKLETESNAEPRPSEAQAMSIGTKTPESLSPVDFRDGFWNPISLPEFAFAKVLPDLNDEHSGESQRLDLDLSGNVTAIPPMFSLHEIQDIAEDQESATVSNIDGELLGSLGIPPLDSGAPTLASPGISRYRARSCGCIQSLADVLENISGDPGYVTDSNNNDGPIRFDILLIHIRCGLETCNTVIPCEYCSVSTTNSMFIVTIVQQLATILQTLCQLLLPYQQIVEGSSTMDSPLLSLDAGIHVGQYEVRSPALCAEFTLSIVRLHFKEFYRLLNHLEKDIKKGTMASRLLSDATDVVRKASCDLNIAQ